MRFKCGCSLETLLPSHVRSLCEPGVEASHVCLNVTRQNFRVTPGRLMTPDASLLHHLSAAQLSGWLGITHPCFEQHLPVFTHFSSRYYPMIVQKIHKIAKCRRRLRLWKQPSKACCFQLGLLDNLKWSQDLLAGLREYSFFCVFLFFTF